MNKTLNEAAYCFEFDKLVDYYDIQEDAEAKNDKVTLDKLLKSNEDLITRSSPYGTHGDHQHVGHNVCSKIVGDEIISYFIDMGDFKFTDKDPLPMEKGGGKKKPRKNQRKKKKKGKVTKASIAYYKIPVKFEIKGNFLGYIKFKRAVSLSNKMLNFDNEIIKVVKGNTTNAIAASGTLTIVGLPDEFL